MPSARARPVPRSLRRALASTGSPARRPSPSSNPSNGCFIPRRWLHWSRGWPVQPGAASPEPISPSTAVCRCDAVAPGPPAGPGSEGLAGPRGTLTGGTPRRTMRLSEAGWRALEALENGNGASTAARRLGRRLIETGLAHPGPSAPHPSPGPRRSSPYGIGQGSSGAASSARGGTRIVVVDDGSRDHEVVLEVARDHRRRPRHRFRPVPALLETQTYSGEDRARGVPRQRLRPERGMARCADRPLPGSSGGGGWAPRTAARGPRCTLLSRYLAARSPLHLGPDELGSSSAPRPRAGRWWP